MTRRERLVITTSDEGTVKIVASAPDRPEETVVVWEIVESTPENRMVLHAIAAVTLALYGLKPSRIGRPQDA